MIDVDYPVLLDNFPEHLVPKRSESASFLIWYLENYYRLDALEAIDSVCDQKGDKGVDGIFVNDNDQTITIFQSRISQNPNTTIGDAALRAFAGTMDQFEPPESITHLINTAGEAEVAALAKRLDLTGKISTHKLRGEFVANINIDQNGKDYLENHPNFLFFGKESLLLSYISDSRDLPVNAPKSFDIVGFQVTEYVADQNTRAIIAPIKASELVTLEGISDQSLFAYNVRGPLGKTKVNRDIVKSIGNPEIHKYFPLFHNGITIISNDLDYLDGEVSISNYFVVNGCQSLTTIFNNKSKITDDLRILVKFIKMDPASTQAADITQFSNNQNAVKSRDFKANHPIQIRLQNEFNEKYKGQYSFEIKRGESVNEGVVISNEDSGLYLMA